MALIFQYSCKDIPWDEVPSLLEKVDMAYTDSHTHKQSFESSSEVVFVFDDKKLVGFGRAISDGVRQAALYDVAVDPSYQGKKIGLEIVKRLMEKLPLCNFILYASPGKEDFYRKLGYKKMKTGMIYFTDLRKMTDANFVEE